jgi:hypothetical protein
VLHRLAGMGYVGPVTLTPREGEVRGLAGVEAVLGRLG